MSDVSALRTTLRHGSGLKRLNGTWGECLAEFLGTFVLLAIGDGSVAMTVAGLPGSGRTQGATTIFLGPSDWLIIAWGWAFAVAFGVYVAGGVSGAHINPAVTLAFAVRRKFPWKKVGPYIVAQVVGAFVGAAVVYMTYHQAIDAYNKAAHVASRSDPGGYVTFSIFATFPAPYFNGGWTGPLIDQIVGTGFLVMFIAAVIDMRNTAVKANMGPLIIGFTVAAVGMTYGANAGYAINPARDFGPRVFAWLEGWGNVAMPGTVHGAGVDYSWYFWIPIVGPIIGGIIGIVLYDFFVGDVLHSRQLNVTPAGPATAEFVDEARETGADRTDAPGRGAHAADEKADDGPSASDEE
ncbi:MIP/aquaporin family protein [Spelaeicoccus albus]|uniref:Glycerol uptake facilitator protein n=1 Tax=Spelaeicoccus albus TaxID=1280376 RepID=A0A7Z0A9E3_9MICO|nr:MIP family channel protein [Spelaeicoccus albus]NYI66003.1 glycerol uptake facilitator protein [Spelaeicoccus albus]